MSVNLALEFVLMPKSICLLQLLSPRILNGFASGVFLVADSMNPPPLDHSSQSQGDLGCESGAWEADSNLLLLFIRRKQALLGLIASFPSRQPSDLVENKMRTGACSGATATDYDGE